MHDAVCHGTDIAQFGVTGMVQCAVVWIGHSLGWHTRCSGMAITQCRVPQSKCRGQRTFLWGGFSPFTLCPLSKLNSGHQTYKHAPEGPEQMFFMLKRSNSFLPWIVVLVPNLRVLHSTKDFLLLGQKDGSTSNGSCCQNPRAEFAAYNPHGGESCLW